MSNHAIEIIEIGRIEPHPNADRMEITKVWGWQCCIGKGQFKSGDRAIYIPPDYEVPNRDEFSFLFKDDKQKERIRVRRFRGELSQGLLIQVPGHINLPIGSNVIDRLGITRYDPPLLISTSGIFIKGPDLYCPKFDVENYQRYPDIIDDNEQVVVTEKIHGANARYVYAKNTNDEWTQFCGSRTNWLAEDEKNIWWKALRQHPEIGEWCKANPDKIIYGEVFGRVQKLRYGTGSNEVQFATFAVLDHQQWIDFEFAHKSVESYNIPWAPVLYVGPFDLKKCETLAELDSSWAGANHMREGVVIQTKSERWDSKIGRVCLKLVSNRYLEKG